jgi:ubiquitin-activating enzyme E1 C
MERPLEVFKMVTMAVKGMNNFMMYNGREGVYTHTVAYEKDDECPACSPGVRVEFSRDVALGDVVDACVKKFPNQCEKPSVSSATAGHLYMRGVFEEETRVNLGKKLVDLVPDDAVDDAGAGTAAEDGTARRIDLEVNDKKMKRSLRLRVFLK